MRRRALGLLLCAATWSAHADAQPRSPAGQGAARTSSDKDADAERLFREGQKLLEERRYGEACPKFEAAYKKDQQLGTLLNLAYCHKEQGATWLSWVEFKEAEVKAIELKRNDRRDFARQRMVELEKSLVRVVVERQQKVELTEILVEDRRVPEAERSIVFAAEPGERKITFRARGKAQVVAYVTLAKGDRPQRITVPPMEDEKEAIAAEPPPTPATDEPRAPAAPSPSPAAGERSSGSGQKTVAIVLAGVGLAGIGAGAVTGLMTLSNPCTDSAKREDPNGCPPNDDGRDKTSRGETTGMISNISFGVGGAALVAALVLYLTEPTGKTDASAARNGVRVTPERARVTPEIGTGWLGLRGVF
jgi:hypothetical protein